MTERNPYGRTPFSRWNIEKSCLLLYVTYALADININVV